MEVIPLEFYISKVLGCIKRFQSLVLNTTHAKAKDPCQFINSWLAAKGKTYRIMGGLYVFVTNPKKEPIILEPGTIFMDAKKKYYICSDIIHSTKNICFYEILSLFEMNLFEDDDIQQALECIKSDEYLVQLTEATVDIQRRCYFILDKNPAHQCSYTNLTVSIITTFKQHDWSMESETFGSIQPLTLICCVENRWNTCTLKLDTLQQRIQKIQHKFGAYYPKQFLRNKIIVLLVEFWTDDFAPFQNSKNPSIS